MACPIMQNGKGQGVLQVVNKAAEGDFDDMDASVVKELAESLGIAFANQRKITGRRSKFDHLLVNGIVSEENMDEAVAHLKSKGVEITVPPVDLGDSFRGEIRDPDGLIIELREWK